MAVATTRLVNGRYQHAAVLTGLQPATRYTYRVYTAGADLTPWTAATFTTATTGGDFTFLVLGDSRGGGRAARALAGQMAARPADLILHAGDLTDNGTQAQLDTQFFAVYRDLLGRVPVYPAPGNHDYAAGALRPYVDSFYLPGDPQVAAGSSPEGLAERAYSFNWGNAHFVALDTNRRYAPGSPQYTWLARDLANTRQLWKFVFFHHPPYSTGSHGSDLNVRRSLTPLFEKYGVDLVFAGHDHLYERSVPLVRGKLAARGVIYVVTGGGGAALYLAGRSNFTAYSRSAYHLTRVEVHNCTLTLQAIALDGAIFDTLVLDKCEAVRRAGPQQPRSTWPAWLRAE
jgi:predicted phosphodiesterase